MVRSSATAMIPGSSVRESDCMYGRSLLGYYQSACVDVCLYATHVVLATLQQLSIWLIIAHLLQPSRGKLYSVIYDTLNTTFVECDRLIPTARKLGTRSGYTLYPFAILWNRRIKSLNFGNSTLVWNMWVLCFIYYVSCR